MNASNPKVSVVVPIYNMGEQLRTAIKHILNQTYENLEIVLVDDGSKDDTYKICSELAGSDSRIRCCRQQNMGSGPARNTGIELCSGKYVYFPDADDMIDADLIKKVSVRMEETGCDIAVFGYKITYPGTPDRIIEKIEGVFDADSIRREYHKFYRFASPSGIQGAPWNKMFSLDVIKKNGVRYPDLRRHQDEVFIMRYMRRAEKAVFIPDALYEYRTDSRERALSKFPKDYFDIVDRLRGYWMEYIYAFNPSNREMLDIICGEYLDRVTVALMMTFNKRFDYGPKQRYAAMKDISERCMESFPDKSYKTGSVMYRLMKARAYPALYPTVYMAFKKYYG